MNILKRFTIKNIKLNKKRSIVTIIGIILSTALICTVAGMFESFRRTMVNAVIKETGDYHAEFVDVDKSDIKYIEENRNVVKTYLSENLGYVKISGDYESFIEINSYNTSYLNDMIKLDSGRLPKNSNEIIISKSLKDDYKLNSEVSLELLKLKDHDQYIYDEDGNLNLIHNIYKKYKVVGYIYEENNYQTKPIISNLDKVENKANVLVKYKNIKDTYKLTKEINEKKYEVNYNSDLLRWSLVLKDDNTIQTLKWIVLIIIFVIVLSSVFVIRNSFAISITEKLKEFGMLSSIGATKKQIRKSVLYEGFILGIIGIPLGIILGFAVIWLLILFSNIMLGSMINELKFVVYIPISAVFSSIILGVITIYLSSIASAYKASKISPIEAIKENNEIKIKSKKVKSPKFIRKIFKIGGDIAYKNLKRNKKKYRTTVISLVVSITIFIALSTFINYGFTMSNRYYKEMPYNVRITDRSDMIKTEKDYNKILESKYIKEYSIKKTNYIELDNKYLTDDGKKFFEDGSNGINILSIGNANYKKYIKELNLNYEDVKDKAIYVKNSIYLDDSKILNAYNFKANQVVEGKINEKNYKIQIAKITDKTGYLIENYAYGSGVLLVSDEMLKNIGVETVEGLDIQSDKPYELTEEINNLEIKELTVANLKEYQDQMNNMVIWISVFLYGFIIVITLIGVTNIFNTITTNMNLRSKEFAMLKSIGMTKKEFNNMIMLESFFYGIKSLFIGCLLGTILSYLIYIAFKNSIDFGFMLPVKAIIISVVFIFSVVGIIMKYSLNKINKQNIIETIRKDNI